MTWIVEMIDAGCDCCSFVPIGEYETEKEAINSMAGDRNLMAYEVEDWEEGEQK